MADTDVLRNYTPSSPPTLGGYELRSLLREFQAIQQSIALLVSVAKELETRIAALEP